MTDPLLAGTHSHTTLTLGDGSKRDSYFNRIGHDFFSTMGIPLVAGRVLDSRDRTGSPPVIVITEAAATALFGNQPPLGRRLTIFNAETEAVGIVRDTKYDSVRRDVDPTMFLPFMLTPAPLTLGAMHVVVRTNIAPTVMTRPLREVVADVDHDVPVSRMKPRRIKFAKRLELNSRSRGCCSRRGVHVIFGASACMG